MLQWLAMNCTKSKNTNMAAPINRLVFSVVDCCQYLFMAANLAMKCIKKKSGNLPDFNQNMR
jgi:hypothetical protein